MTARGCAVVIALMLAYFCWSRALAEQPPRGEPSGGEQCTEQERTSEGALDQVVGRDDGESKADNHAPNGHDSAQLWTRLDLLTLYLVVFTGALVAVGIVASWLTFKLERPRATPLAAGY